MRLPAPFRTTPFRLTLMFLAVFLLAAAALLFYIYAVTAGEVTRRADQEIAAEMRSLETVYRQGGINALNQELIERTADGRPFLYLLVNKNGEHTGTIATSPFSANEKGFKQFRVAEPDPSGAVVRQPAP